MLLTVVISGTVLVLAGIAGNIILYRTGLRAIDRQIREMGHRELMRTHPDFQWANLEHALEFVYGRQPGSVVILVRHRNGDVQYESPGWPAGLDPDLFPEPDTVDHDVPRAVRDGGPPRHPRPLPRDDPSGMRRRPPEWDRPGDPDRHREFDGMDDHNPPPPALPLMTTRFPVMKSDTDQWRVGTVGTDAVTMLVAVNLRELDAEVKRISQVFFSILPMALLLIAAGGWVIAKRALKPVRLLTATAEKITAEDLDQRVSPEQTDAEFMRLIDVFNGMLDRLQRSFHQAIRFSENAAHELKTPLAILQGELEQAIQTVPDGSKIQRTLGTLLEETSRLTSITRKLLFLARTDAGHLTLNRERFDLTEIVALASEDLTDLAHDISVTSEINPDLWISGDAQLIQQVLMNLTSNALKYNQPGGFIQIKAAQEANKIHVTISNSGHGIPAEEHEKIFQRFYRGEQSRNRDTDGFGLGLAISREIVRAHGGELKLVSSREGATCFVMLLPEEPSSET